MGRGADTSESHPASQSDLNRMEKWAKKSIIKFNKAKCKENKPVLAEKRLCRRGPGGPGGQAEHEPAKCHCGKECQCYPELN